MKLVALEIRRLPGLDEPFRLEPGTGVNLLVGPNASGKSSLARAVRDLLWPPAHNEEVRWLEAVFRDRDGDLAVACDGGSPVWHRGGETVAPPPLPPPHLADCYRLTAPDLLAGASRLDRKLAAEIRREMTGGFDLDGLAAALAKPSVRRARDLVKAREQARAEAVRIGREQAELANRRDTLGALRARIDAATAAERRRQALAALRDLRAARQAREAAADELAAFPPVMGSVRDEDATTFLRLRERLAARQQRALHLGDEIDELERRLAALSVPTGDDPEPRVARVARLVEGCSAAAGTLARQSERRATAERFLQSAEIAATSDPDSGDILVRLERALADLDAGTDAVTAERTAAGAEPERFGAAVAALVLAVVLLVLAASPLLPEGFWRTGILGIGLAAGFAGVRTLVRAAARRARAAQRAELDGLATRARAKRDVVDRRRRELAEAVSAAAEAQQQLDAVLAETSRALEPWGIPAPETATAAEAALADLRRRLERFGDLSERRLAAHEERREAVRDVEVARAEINALLARLQLALETEDATPVAALVDRLESWRAAQASWNTAEALCRSRAEEYTARAVAAGLPPEPEEFSELDLDDAIAMAAEDAEAASALQQELGGLLRDIERAGEQHDLGEALRREQVCEDDLAAWRDRAREDLAAAFLLEDVRRQHDVIAAPVQLAEANRLLDEFTAGRHALAVLRGAEGPTFVVEDRHAGRHLRLPQLSDGTRAQVLLAARVAFIGSAEPGPRPPLFLDETLTTSDPVRLAAVATSLGRLATTAGRQIFYLTSQPGDVAAWQSALGDAGLPAANVLDLADIRSLAAAAAPANLAPPTLPVVPSPAGLGEAAYGELLRVRRFDPQASWETTDTFHLAAPDLELVRHLREAGQEVAGTVAAALPRLVAGGVVAHAAAERLGVALATLKVFTDLWRIGRPRPVTPDDIDASGAISATMRPRVLEVLARHRWNAARFLAAARAGEVRGFRGDKIDALAEHLADTGCLDERVPMDDMALVGEVALQVVAGPQTRARTSLNEVRALVHRLLRAIPQEIVDDPSSRSSGSGPTG